MLEILGTITILHNRIKHSVLSLKLREYSSLIKSDKFYNKEVEDVIICVLELDEDQFLQYCYENNDYA